MQIALIEQDNISVADYRELFPQTSFRAGGPTDEWLAENSCKKVSVFLPHDRAIEKLVSCEPYVDGEFVYTVKVEPLTDAELAAIAETERAKTNAAIWSKIDAIERKHQMPRHLRELIPAGHPARSKVDVVEGEIAALKAGLL